MPSLVIAISPDSFSSLLLVLSLGLAFLPVALALNPVRLVLVARLVADLDPVEPYRAADVHAVPDVPRVVAPCAVQRPAARAEDFERLGLVEDVLVERPAIDVAPGEHLLHERVEVVGWRCRRGWRPRRRVAWAKTETPVSETAHHSAHARARETGRRFTGPPGWGGLAGVILDESWVACPFVASFTVGNNSRPNLLTIGPDKLGLRPCTDV